VRWRSGIQIGRFLYGVVRLEHELHSRRKRYAQDVVYGGSVDEIHPQPQPQSDFVSLAGCVGASTCCMMLQPRRRHASYCFHGSALADMGSPSCHISCTVRLSGPAAASSIEEAVTEDSSFSPTTIGRLTESLPASSKLVRIPTWPMIR
jgi:hypothetical protein